MKSRAGLPRRERRFAGDEPGEAVAGRELETQGGPRYEQLFFEEIAGVVGVRLMRERDAVVGAELTAPEPLSRGATVSVEDAAACLCVAASHVSSTHHLPQVVSVGLPFLTVELTSREALRQSKPNALAHERVLPPIGTDGVFAYVHGQHAGELHARMFSPLDATPEDPATGSATAATIAHLTLLRPERDAELAWRIEQGRDMGRPSLILGRTYKRDGVVAAVHVGGHAVPVMRGTLCVD